MARQVTISLTDSEAERLDMLVVRAQNQGDFDGAERSEPLSLRAIARKALLAYIDFNEKLHAGELDGDPSTPLLLHTVDGIDYLA